MIKNKAFRVEGFRHISIAYKYPNLPVFRNASSSLYVSYNYSLRRKSNRESFFCQINVVFHFSPQLTTVNFHS